MNPNRVLAMMSCYMSVGRNEETVAQIFKCAVAEVNSTLDQLDGMTTIEQVYERLGLPAGTESDYEQRVAGYIKLLRS